MDVQADERRPRRIIITTRGKREERKIWIILPNILLYHKKRGWKWKGRNFSKKNAEFTKNLNIGCWKSEQINMGQFSTKFNPVWSSFDLLAWFVLTIFDIFSIIPKLALYLYFYGNKSIETCVTLWLVCLCCLETNLLNVAADLKTLYLMIVCYNYSLFSTLKA